VDYRTFSSLSSCVSRPATRRPSRLECYCASQHPQLNSAPERLPAYCSLPALPFRSKITAEKEDGSLSPSFISFENGNEPPSYALPAYLPARPLARGCPSKFQPVLLYGSSPQHNYTPTQEKAVQKTLKDVNNKTRRRSIANVTHRFICSIVVTQYKLHSSSPCSCSCSCSRSCSRLLSNLTHRSQSQLQFRCKQTKEGCRSTYCCEGEFQSRFLKLRSVVTFSVISWLLHLRMCHCMTRSSNPESEGWSLACTAI
jgi:hypothetical protein